MKRDKRLLIAMLIFGLSAIAWAVQAWITALYVDAAVLGDWSYFAKMFSVAPPASGPERFCLDYCAAYLPFAAGWVGIFAFLTGWVMVAYTWWKPKS